MWMGMWPSGEGSKGGASQTGAGSFTALPVILHPPLLLVLLLLAQGTIRTGGLILVPHLPPVKAAPNGAFKKKLRCFTYLIFC